MAACKVLGAAIEDIMSAAEAAGHGLNFPARGRDGPTPAAWPQFFKRSITREEGEGAPSAFVAEEILSSWDVSQLWQFRGT